MNTLTENYLKKPAVIFPQISYVNRDPNSLAYSIENPNLRRNSLFPTKFEQYSNTTSISKAVGTPWYNSLPSSETSSISSSPILFSSDSPTLETDSVWDEFNQNGITRDFVEDLNEITGRPWNFKKKITIKSSLKFCVFCKNNNLSREEYESHKIRNEEGLTTCPVLRRYKCPICQKVGGDSGHTTRYCPENKKSSWGLSRKF